MLRHPITVRGVGSAPEYTGAMPVILVLDDDVATRDALVETLRNLFTQARVVTAPAERLAAALGPMLGGSRPRDHR